MKLIRLVKLTLVLTGALGLTWFFSTHTGYIAFSPLATEGAAIGFVALTSLGLILPGASRGQKYSETSTRKNGFSPHLFFENAKDVLFSYRLTGSPQLQYISASVEQLTGYTAQDFYEDPLLGQKLLHTADRPNHVGLSLFSVPRSSAFQVRITARDDRVKWIELQTWPLLDTRGDPIGVEGIIREITERKQIADENAQTAMFLASVLDHTAEAILVTDEFGNILHLNNSFITVWEIPRPLAHLRDPKVYVYAYEQLDEDAEDFSKTVQDLYASGIRSATGRISLKNGRYLEYTTESYHLEDTILRVWTFIDVSANLIMLKALKESVDRHDLVFEGSKDVIWEWDLTANRLMYSRRWHEILGTEVDEFGSRPGAWMERIHPRDIDLFESNLRKHLQGTTTRFESRYRIRCEDGSYRWMNCSGVALRDETGEVVRVAGSQTLLDDQPA